MIDDPRTPRDAAPPETDEGTVPDRREGRRARERRPTSIRRAIRDELADDPTDEYYNETHPQEHRAVPVIELDQLFWQPGLIPTPRDRWVDIQQELARAGRWIIDGDLGPYDMQVHRLRTPAAVDRLLAATPDVREPDG